MYNCWKKPLSVSVCLCCENGKSLWCRRLQFSTTAVLQNSVVRRPQARAGLNKIYTLKFNAFGKFTFALLTESS